MPLTVKRLLILLLTLTTIALIEWYWVPEPKLPKVGRPVVETWSLPVELKTDTKAALDLLNGMSLWGNIANTAPTEPPKEPNWRFFGVIGRGVERYVIIKFDNKPEQQLKVGENLPGGSTILKIDNDKLCILINGKKRTIGIYKQGSQIL